jgi:two-component system chemotaxis response regulator CheY
MSKTVLIADDSMLMRQMIRDTLTTAGWTVVGEAVNGADAVEKYSALHPAAMTLDLVMPETDGLYALKNIIATDPNAKIVVCSALEQTDVLKEAFRLGASDFVVKPFDRSALAATVERVVG